MRYYGVTKEIQYYFSEEEITSEGESYLLQEQLKFLTQSKEEIRLSALITPKNIQIGTYGCKIQVYCYGDNGLKTKADDIATFVKIVN